MMSRDQTENMHDISTTTPSVDSSFEDSLPLEVPSSPEELESQSAYEDKEPVEGSLTIEHFTKNLSSLSTPEEKIRFSIDYMKKALSQEGSPYFKGFWEARSQCANLFKETISAQSRSELWTEYRNLCQEFKKLKEMLDEQASFAAEQIDIAIQALGHDLNHFSELLNKIAPLSFNPQPKSLQKNIKIYNELQKELNLLNTYASKVNSLRKELIKTEMRIRQKNKFFQQLSSIGDKIFPRRKELIKKLSDQFVCDVNTFVQAHFRENQVQSPLFFVREEIKALQGIAKILTLNTFSFTNTRAELSKCWDMVKTLEKVKKKEQSEKRVVYKENLELALAKVQVFKEAVINGEIIATDLNVKTEELFQYMRTLDLGKEEKFAINEAIRLASTPLLEELHREENERINKEKALAKEKSDKVIAFKERLQELMDTADSKDVDTLIATRDCLLEELHTLPCHKTEKISLEKSLKKIKDIISDKAEKALLSLSADDLNALEQLKSALSSRKARREQIKLRIEEHRKISGGSSLSFEKALSFHETIREEKLELEKIDAGIKELEQKIRALSHKK